MIKYVALMKMRDDTPLDELNRIEGDLRMLGKLIVQVSGWSTGRCIDSVGTDTSYTFVVVADFKDLEAYNAYVKHPEHMAFKERVKPYLEKVNRLHYEAQYLPRLGLIRYEGGVPELLNPLPPLQI